MSLKVTLFPILEDNYVFIAESGGEIAIVDPGDAKPVTHALSKLTATPKIILNTHHHIDHVGGNLELKNKYNLKIYASEYDKDRIPGADELLSGGETIPLGNTSCEVISVPGHTQGHLAYYFKEDQVLFVGDTLFSLGCGRLKEGTPEQMLESLMKIAGLPDSVKIYCAHEYTQKNADFAAKVDHKNVDLIEYNKHVLNLRNNMQPTIPTLLKTEKLCNPFLRSSEAAISKYFKIAPPNQLEGFTLLRKYRDSF